MMDQSIRPLSEAEQYAKEQAESAQSQQEPGYEVDAAGTYTGDEE